MDSLQEYEIAELYNYLQYSDRNLYDVGRMVAYFAISPYLKEKITMSEFLELPWEKEDTVESKLSDKQIERMRRKAKQYNRQTKK